MQAGIDTELSEIPRVVNISYEEFVEKFLSKNQPCLLEESYTRSWRSRQEWVLNGKPHYELLRRCFGESIVPVADCNKVQFQSHPKQSMLFQDFIDYWKDCDGVGKSSKNAKVSWYLKDWHFCKSFPDYNAYETPQFFKSDWLNEFWDKWSEMKDDYRFVYMGPKGTWTPFHADVFRSYSWSANICGHKKWILYPPGAEEYLKDIHGNLIFDLTSSDKSDQKKFPNFFKAPKPLVVDQNEGEIIFVPSFWHHQVINEEDTISINHNWINGSGILWSWQHLKSELQLVKYSIDDCKNMDGWDNQCQVILEANSGINFQGFFKVLNYIAASRVAFLRTLRPKTFTFTLQDEAGPQVQDEALQLTLGMNELISTDQEVLSMVAKENMFNTSELCVFDLQKIKDVLEQFILDEDLEEILKQQAIDVFNDIRFSEYAFCKERILHGNAKI